MSSSIIIKKEPGATLSLQGSRPQRPRIPGVFPATQFGEQVVSTGIPSLDGYIGGGILLGSILVIKDEYPSRYADLILKCFLAEGATCNHHLFVSAGQVESAKFAEELPSLKKGREKATREDSSSTTSISRESNDMKIAWRYQNAAPLPVTLSSRGGIIKGQKLAKFEFTKRSTVKALGGTNLHLSKLEDGNDCNPPHPQLLLREIADVVAQFDLTNTVTDRNQITNNLLRIGLSHCEAQVLDVNFMFGLRALVQSTNSCAFITLSTIRSEPKLVSRLENLADMVIQLEAIVDTKKKEELGGVDGLCKVQKISSLNSLKPFVPPSDLGFTYKHKCITFQELHLPPEGETTAQREVGHKSHPQLTQSSSSCGGSKGTAIDF